jgi:hypothetical protein
MASAEIALFVGGVVFAVRSVWRRVFCGSICLGTRLLWFDPFGDVSLRFNPFGDVSFAVRSVWGVVFEVQSVCRCVFCGSLSCLTDCSFGCVSFLLIMSTSSNSHSIHNVWRKT